MQEATLSDRHFNRFRLMQSAMWGSLSSLTCTQMLAARINSPSEPKANLSKLLMSYPILVANKLASKHRSIVTDNTYGTAPTGFRYIQDTKTLKM